MSEQENPLERDGTVVMPRFQSALHDLSTKLRELQQESEAKRLAELRSLIREEVDRALRPGMPDPRIFLDAEVRDPETGHRYRGTLYLIERTEVDET